MKCDFCGWDSIAESDTCPNCNRKYIDSDVLRKARKAFIISVVVYFFGLILVPLLLNFADLAVFLVFWVVLLNFQGIFFAIRFKVIRDRFYKNLGQKVETGGSTTVTRQTPRVARYSKIRLPRGPLSQAPDLGFIYPGMAEELRPAAESNFERTDSAVMEVRYSSQSLLSFNFGCYLNEDKTAVAHGITVSLSFSRFVDSEQVLERFKKSGIADNFKLTDRYIDINYDNKEGVLATAECGSDLEKAMKLASYILANVLYIPVHTRLTYKFNYWFDPTFVNYILVKTPSVTTSAEIDPEHFVFSGMEEFLQECAKDVFSVKGASGQFTFNVTEEASVREKAPITVNMGVVKNEDGESKNEIVVVCTPLPTENRRFKINHFVKDFEIEYKADGAMEKACASYGVDVNKVAKVVSCLLASVFHVPLNAEIGYGEENCDDDQ